METNEIYFSTQWKNMLGYADNEIENKLEEWEKRVHLDDVTAVHAEINKHLEGLTPFYSSEHRLLCKDGTYKWVLDRGKVMQFDNEGKPLRFIGTHKDISDRKEKELQLAYERFLLDSLMDFTPESIFFKDLDSKFIRANKTAAINLGCKEVSEIIGKSDFDFYDKELAEECFQTEQEIIRTGIPYHAEEYRQSKNGPKNWGITRKMPLLDPEGKIVGTFGMSVNINEIKKAGDALRESEEYTKSILQAIPDLIFIMDSDAAFLDYRTSSDEMLAFPKEFFLQKSVLEVFPNKLGVKFRDAIKTVIETQQKLTIEYDLDANNIYGNYECYLYPFSNQRVIAIVHNVTIQKQNEEELRISRNQLKNFAAHLQDVREEERVLLAREIHDDLGQILVALKIDIGIFKQQVLKNINETALADVQVQIDKIYNLVDKTIKTTRKIMTGLRPEVLELVGFQESVRLYIEEFKDRYKLTCKCHCPENEVSVDPEKSIALFRILQEALTNIAKHANATEIEVSLEVVDNQLNMRIADNGVGLDQNKEARQDSYGLIGMKERVYLLDGKLSITSAPGEGTVVFVEMPYQN
jgi:PAS domain S-box-containing protein